MNIYHHNQYDMLQSCLLCYPVNFQINKKSNPYYNKINYSLLYKQYNDFVNELSNNNVKINFINPDKNAYEQIYVQDIGFIIEDVFFISKMYKEVRQIETSSLREFISKHHLKFYEMKNNIEGGDVLHHNDVIFIGLSTRTTLSAVEEIKGVLNSFNIKAEVIPVAFDTTKPHLDCVFNTLDKDHAVICPYVFDYEVIKKYIHNLYEITKTDADNFGTNFVNLGDKKVLCSNINVSKMLKKEGYATTYIDYSEVIKNEGSLGCSILYLNRKHNE